MPNAKDLTVQELAAFCSNTDDIELARWRDKATATCAQKFAAGTYLPGLAYRDYQWLVDCASMWLKARPDAPIRRDGEHVRYAHCRATRKAAARNLAIHWQREKVKC